MTSTPRQKRAPRPLDAARLDELALAYVARFAASAAKLESYLKRKVRERGWVGATGPDGESRSESGPEARPESGEDFSPEISPDTLISELVARFVRAGYVDDAAFARAKAGSLRRRGYGERRVAQALDAAGIASEVRAEIRAGEGDQRRSALALASKRRFGPWGPPVDRPAREKQLAAMLRAGHRLDMARAVIHAPDIESAQEWAVEEDE